MKLYATLALLFTLSLAGSAQAQVLDASLDANLTGSSSETVLDASLDSGARMNEEDTAETVGAESALDISFSRNSIKEGTTYNVTESGRVRSASSLESYLGASVQNDERLESVAISENQMNLTYKRDGRLLWIIPIQMHTDVSVDAEGTVDVRYPWYSFLVATSESQADLEARLASEVASIETNLAGNAETERSGTSQSGIQIGSDEVRRWARILESIHAGLSVEVAA